MWVKITDAAKAAIRAKVRGERFPYRVNAEGALWFDRFTYERLLSHQAPGEELSDTIIRACEAIDADGKARPLQ